MTSTYTDYLRRDGFIQRNAFRDVWTRELDKKYMRVCSVHRLLQRGRIGFARAIQLLAQRHTKSEMKLLRGTVELWRGNHLKEMLP